MSKKKRKIALFFQQFNYFFVEYDIIILYIINIIVETH